MDRNWKEGEAHPPHPTDSSAVKIFPSCLHAHIQLEISQELPDAYYASHALPITWQGKDGSSAAVQSDTFGVVHCCHSCLTPLFHAGNIVFKSKGGGGTESGVGFFIEPIKWMQAQRVNRSAVCSNDVTHRSAARLRRADVDFDSCLTFRLSGNFECPNCRFLIALIQTHHATKVDSPAVLLMTLAGRRWVTGIGMDCRVASCLL